jgi:hypothetical protein
MKKIPKFDRTTKIKTVKRMLRGENISHRAYRK